MALYSNSAFPHSILRAGNNPWPMYLFGQIGGANQSLQVPFLYKVTNVALTSNVATISVSLISGGGPAPYPLQGSIPAVGAKMGVQGTTAASGAFNVDPATITAVSFASAASGTISFALTHANVASAADIGTVVVQPYEYPDLVVSGSASQPFAVTSTPDESDNSRSIFAEAKWYGTMPSAATVVLQVANVDDDSRYYTIENAQGVLGSGTVAASDALATIAGSAVTQSGAEYSFIIGKFIRAKVLSITGGDGTTGIVVTISA